MAIEQHSWSQEYQGYEIPSFWQQLVQISPDHEDHKLIVSETMKKKIKFDVPRILINKYLHKGVTIGQLPSLQFPVAVYIVVQKILVLLLKDVQKILILDKYIPNCLPSKKGMPKIVKIQKKCGNIYLCNIFNLLITNPSPQFKATLQM